MSGMPNLPVRFGGTTFSFMWQITALEAMRKLRPLGLNDFDVITVPGHLWPEEMTTDQRRTLRWELEGEGTRLESLNVPALDVNLASCVSAVRKSAVECYRTVFQLSAELGGKGVVVVPGRVSGLLPPALSDSVNWLSESMLELLAVARELDQTVLMESHPQTPIPRYPEILEFIERFGDSRLKVAYDVANAEFIGESQKEALIALSKHLGQLHLSDATRTSWKHDRVGKGSIDFKEVLETLEEIGFQGVSIVEVISSAAEQDTRQSVQLLTEMLPKEGLE